MKNIVVDLKGMEVIVENLEETKGWDRIWLRQMYRDLTKLTAYLVEVMVM